MHGDSFEELSGDQVVASQGQRRQPLPLIWTVGRQLWQRDQCLAGTGDLVFTRLFVREHTRTILPRGRRYTRQCHLTGSGRGKPSHRRRARPHGRVGSLDPRHLAESAAGPVRRPVVWS